MNRHHTVPLRCLGLLAAAIAAAGCGDANKPPTYGSTMSPSASSNMTGSMVAPTVVPAGAALLSTGTFDQIRFQVPGGSGAIYIYDEDLSKVVGMTNYASDAEAGRTKTMADLSNITQDLSKTDHYRIYFGQLHPTTHPIGGM